MFFLHLREFFYLFLLCFLLLFLWLCWCSPFSLSLSFRQDSAFHIDCDNTNTTKKHKAQIQPAFQVEVKKQNFSFVYAFSPIFATRTLWPF